MKKLLLLAITSLISVTISFSQPCLPDGITFTTQAQVDNFQANYPDCTEIEGDVDISGAGISNLNGLSVLTSIEGDLYILNNTALSSLTGLEGLNSIGAYLKIYYNHALTTLTGLEGLTSSGYLSIQNNDALTSLTGLEGLTSVGGGLDIQNNYALTSLTGLEGLTSIGGYLCIQGNDALTSIAGLESLMSIDHLCIDENDALTSLTGLEGLTSTGGLLEILDNDVLTSLEGLEGLTSVGGYLDILSNDALTSLTGLDGLTSTGGGLKIYGNYVLNSLMGLEGLTSIGGYLEIQNNESLTSLAGLDNIEEESITDLEIQYNDLLSTCEVQSVCNYLSAPNGDVSIHDNASGCNSQEEVEEACEAVSIGEFNKSAILKTQPNPFTTSTTIAYQLDHSSEITLTIYNHLGKQVEIILQYQSIVKQQITWNADGLPPGMYFFTIKAGDQVAAGKLLKFD